MAGGFVFPKIGYPLCIHRIKRKSAVEPELFSAKKAIIMNEIPLVDAANSASRIQVIINKKKPNLLKVR
jgi:hypothetical protein